jgi:hypothetical protein
MAEAQKTVKKTWEKTRVQFLYKHKSGGDYARIFAGGNEHWQKLDTDLFEVARAKLPGTLHGEQPSIPSSGRPSGSLHRRWTKAKQPTKLKNYPQRLTLYVARNGKSDECL